MNFKDLELMNNAFLVKQFWCILESHNSLVSRCLKAIYLANSSLLDSELRHNSSFVWRGKWRVGMRASQWMCLNNDKTLTWKGDLSGLFSVKSAYSCFKQLRDAKAL